jgi:hypothetical protein
MTDSPPRGLSTSLGPPALEPHDDRPNAPTPRTGSTVSTFSELNSIRPLDVRLQDLRPLRGRPSADPGPSRLTGVYPYTVGENKIRDNKPTQPP